ncbi:MAG: hypothetical protein FD127_123 [Acidimicrobiaceae bacterium]|nr:MAG: hypothetical protein FD127_123 [Acidimicrobiaceae bacterium]
MFKKCNNDWMSGLESGAIAIVEPLMRGSEARLPLGDRVVLATWAAKTATFLDGYVGQFLRVISARLMLQRRVGGLWLARERRRRPLMMSAAWPVPAWVMLSSLLPRGNHQPDCGCRFRSGRVATANAGRRTSSRSGRWRRWSHTRPFRPLVEGERAKHVLGDWPEPFDQPGEQFACGVAAWHGDRDARSGDGFEQPDHRRTVRFADDEGVGPQRPCHETA